MLRNKFDLLVQKHNFNRFHKTFDSWTQLVTMHFGAFSRYDSMGEICDAMQGLAGKLNHLSMENSPAKSTASNEFRERESIL